MLQEKLKFETLCDAGTLRKAYDDIQKDSPGLSRHYDPHSKLANLRNDLLRGSYRHEECKLRSRIVSGKLRDIDEPSLRDKILQKAWSTQISEAADGDFSPRSHGYRPNRSCQTALVAAVDELDSAPYSWVLKADIKSFFEHIPRSALKHILRDKIRDPATLNIGLHLLDRAETFKGSEFGLPTGWLISPILANLLLDPIDTELAQAGFFHLRYADDYFIPTTSEDAARHAHHLLGLRLNSIGLCLNSSEDKTYVLPLQSEKVTLLGHRIYSTENGYGLYPSKTKIDTLRAEADQLFRDSARNRKFGWVLKTLSEKVTSWASYFTVHHSPPPDNPAVRALADLNASIRTRVTERLAQRSGFENQEFRYANLLKSVTFRATSLEVVRSRIADRSKP